MNETNQTNQPNIEINKDFRPEREALNLSQQDAAMLIDVSRVTYNKYETEPETMPIGKYEQLMQEFARLRELQPKSTN